jgi:hypothetical protein
MLQDFKFIITSDQGAGFLPVLSNFRGRSSLYPISGPGKTPLLGVRFHKYGRPRDMADICGAMGLSLKMINEEIAAPCSALGNGQGGRRDSRE